MQNIVLVRTGTRGEFIVELSIVAWKGGHTDNPWT